MDQISIRRSRLTGAGAALAIALVATACGSAPSPAGASSAPSVAAASPSPSVASVAPSPSAPPAASASTAPAGSGSTAVDPAAGITIDAPYSIAALPAAMQTLFEQQMSTSLGAFGNNITFGFRQINGGKGQDFLMVLAFPAGSVTAATFTGMVGGLGGSMGATLTKTTVDGIDVHSGPSSTGGVALFHVGDQVLIVISQDKADPLAIAKALISSNQ